MTSYLLVGPAAEPISLAQAKAFLRVDSSDEDDFINTLISAARLHVESVTGRALINQTWRVNLDDWPVEQTVVLPLTPISSLSAITAYDTSGSPVVLSLGQFDVDARSVPARLFVPDVVTDMPALQQHNGIEIDYIAGFGAAPEDVPADLAQALLSLVAYWFEHRDAVVIAGSGSVVPPGFDMLVAAYKQVRL